MIRKTIFAAAALLTGLCGYASARNSLVGLTPYVPEEIQISGAQRNMLGQKLLQMATTNGFASASGEFVLTVNVIPLEKHAIPSVPPQVSVKMEISIYAVAVQEQAVVDEMSLEVTGTGRNESQAVTKALGKLNPRNADSRAFMASVRRNIEEYYTERVPAITAKARLLADKGEYEAALAALSVIPETVAEYETALTMMTQIHTQMLDRQADSLLSMAQAKTAAGDYAGALDALLKVDPLSGLAPQARQKRDEVCRMMEEQQRLAYEERLRRQDMEAEMAEKARAEGGYRDMQVEASYRTAEDWNRETSGSVVSGIKEWLYGKLI